MKKVSGTPERVCIKTVHGFDSSSVFSTLQILFFYKHSYYDKVAITLSASSPTLLK